MTLPLALRYFVQLPDRGYALARPLGILLFGLLFWLGYSYGLVRNEAGGAWLAVFGLAALSVAAGWRQLRSGQACPAATARLALYPGGGTSFSGGFCAVGGGAGL